MKNNKELSYSLDNLPFDVSAETESIHKQLKKWRKKCPGALMDAIAAEYHFGTCFCGKDNKYFNNRKTHYFYCDNCEVVWRIGVNLFSSWKDESEEIWKANTKKFARYIAIDPAIFCCPTILTKEDGPNLIDNLQESACDVNNNE